MRIFVVTGFLDNIGKDATFFKVKSMIVFVNNRSGWKRTYTVAVSMLCSKGNLSKSAFKRARTE